MYEVRKHKYRNIWWILDVSNQRWMHKDFLRIEDAERACANLNERSVRGHTKESDK